MNKYELYKAVRHQVYEYSAEHGMDLVTMWKAVSDDNPDVDAQMFWKNTCIDQYTWDILDPKPLRADVWNRNSVLRSRGELVHVPKRHRMEVK